MRAVSSSTPSQLVSVPRGRGGASSACGPLAPTGWEQHGAQSYQLEVETKFPPWRRPVCGRPPPRLSGRKLTTHWSSLLPRPERRCWRPFLLGPRDPGPQDSLWLEAPEHGWAPASPCPFDFPKPLLRGWTWRLGAKDCELGWPKEPELALGTSWATSPSPTPPPSFKDCLSECGGGSGGRVAALQTAKAAVELVFWSPREKALRPWL